ncbi:hypothetical protein DACRYDRAFT_112852 [Dacryopinax primogenitus]|uniref:Structure-specific endonuclease subunit SLX1 C-terminal domain-containing protein n=1 Tax=Dacryopinax primogenitus (strain DJM 731) TaxID=1858805 RepID=M5GC58_DACPD|nr:uncharacterized protein DACRYDRAFT_112852 [Dacryopinax primogenitus]EJU06070.1 hypothetical protein DACRYDRAFT_112852 [Dacryopinax primogenitus]
MATYRKIQALQFEWALQHPSRSRHLQPQFPRRKHNLSWIVQVVKTMLMSKPFSVLPLHVTLLDPQAQSVWTSLPLPIPGGCVVRSPLPLESDDMGKMFDTLDTDFRDRMLSKSLLLQKHKKHTCSICHSPVSLSPLTSAICPSGSCNSIAHLLCLGREFARSEGEGLLPRQGVCNACGEKMLWGDVVRGCYHRLRAVSVRVEEGKEEGEGEGEEEVEEEGSGTRKGKKARTSRTSTSTRTSTTKQAARGRKTKERTRSEPKSKSKGTSESKSESRSESKSKSKSKSEPNPEGATVSTLSKRKKSPKPSDGGEPNTNPTTLATAMSTAGTEAIAGVEHPHTLPVQPLEEVCAKRGRGRPRKALALA